MRRIISAPHAYSLFDQFEEACFEDIEIPDNRVDDLGILLNCIRGDQRVMEALCEPDSDSMLHVIGKVEDLYRGLKAVTMRALEVHAHLDVTPNPRDISTEEILARESPELKAIRQTLQEHDQRVVAKYRRGEEVIVRLVLLGYTADGDAVRDLLDIIRAAEEAIDASEQELPRGGE